MYVLESIKVFMFNVLDIIVLNEFVLLCKTSKPPPHTKRRQEKQEIGFCVSDFIFQRYSECGLEWQLYMK